MGCISQQESAQNVHAAKKKRSFPVPRIRLNNLALFASIPSIIGLSAISALSSLSAFRIESTARLAQQQHNGSFMKSRNHKKVFLSPPVDSVSTAKEYPQHQELLRILCYGDSLTYGTAPPLDGAFPYGPHLERALTSRLGRLKSMGGRKEGMVLPGRVVVRWRGIPGWTASMMVNYADDPNVGLRSTVRNVRNPNIALVLILAGTNDLGYSIASPNAAETVVNAITQLHEMAHAEGVQTLAISIPTSGWQRSSYEAAELAEEVNMRLCRWCADVGEDRVSFVRFPFGWEGNANNKIDTRWSIDGLHLSPEGYQALGERLAPVVSSLIFRHVTQEDA